MRVLVHVLIAALATFGSVESVWAQAEERTIYASVFDKADSPVKGLAGSEFIVREDGVAREVLRASPATEPMQIALLVDTSAAAEPYLLDLRRGLSAFFKQVGGKHDVALIGFGERPTVIVDYTRDAARLEQGLGNIFARPGSGTYLMEAIMEAADALRRRKPERPHIVVVSGVGPEFSETHHDNVLD